MKRFFGCLTIILTFHSFSIAQIDSIYTIAKKGLKFQLAEKPNSFIKFGFHTQLWARFTEMNPGTKDYQGNTIKYDIDFLMRRTAFTSLLVLDKFKFFTNLTVTSQSNTNAVTPYITRSPKLYFYDIWTSYDIKKNYLTVGGGLHMYNGISRYTSASSMKSLGADVPFIAAPNLLTTDQAARQMGIFATGNIKSFAYRLAVNKPFATSTTQGFYFPTSINHQLTHNFSYTGYFEYYFFTKESNFMPFKQATYLGAKKMLNIGAGFYHHKSATLDVRGKEYDITHLAVDVFFEYPFENKGAITFYGSFFKFEYGKGYLHQFGVQESFEHAATEFQYGSGNASLIQIAYLIPSNKTTKRIQPYYELTVRDFNGLSKTLYHHNAGINYFVIEHHIKLTLQYENRPFHIINQAFDRKSMVIGKIQISI